MPASAQTMLAPFGGGRILIEIVGWDSHLHVGLPPAAMPAEERVQGLFFNRGFDIEGRILAPHEIRGERVLVYSLVIRPDVDLNPDGHGRVGSFYDHRSEPDRNGFSANLILPQDGLMTALAGLAATWRYIHVWVRDEPGEQKDIRDYSFSRAIPPRLTAWVEED